ncbi:MAG TPA: hypothetical protein VKU86_13250 [Acidimicrobiales bacterium]|nr:hypothetical protein [Acidimicrobiales bacterium]
MTSVVQSGPKRRLGPPRLNLGPLTAAQKMWAVVFSLVGMIVATVVGTIVIAIIVGLADGH